MTKTALAFLALLLPGLALPDDASTSEELAALFPGVTAAQIRAAPLPGFFEVRIGAEIVYISEDGRYLLQGEIYDVANEQNLTELRRFSVRAEAVEEAGEETMVIFTPAEYAHTITVFTDIDCGYCRRLQREIAQYLARGIRVRYLFFPRSGPDTDSWTKAEQVWCSPDRRDAMNRAKRGEVLKAPVCEETPVSAHYDLGRALGIRGTPALITEAGELIPGYLPANDLLRRLNGSR